MNVRPAPRAGSAALLLRRLLPALALVLLLVVPATASAADAVVEDCNDNGRLDKTYKSSEYATALQNIPTDVDEYTDCRDVIRRAQLGIGSKTGSSTGGTTGGTGSSGGTGGSGAAGGATATPGAAAPSDAVSAASQKDAAEVLAAASPEQKAAIEQLQQAGSPPVPAGDPIVPEDRLGFGNTAAVNGIPGSLIVVLVLLAVAAAGAAVVTVQRRVHTRRHGT